MRTISSISKIIVLAAIVIVALLFLKPQTQEAAQDPAYPLDNFDDRPRLLTFGLFVTPDPEQNPIDPPERFTGFHTALDLESLPEEENEEVKVYAICNGPIRFAGLQNGYGGVMIQECQIQNQAVTVLYGHVEPATFKYQVGQTVEKGAQIAALASAHSEGSGLTRKHLHLGIHKGTRIEYLGYVQEEAQLAEYIDPATLFQ